MAFTAELSATPLAVERAKLHWQQLSSEANHRRADG